MISVENVVKAIRGPARPSTGAPSTVRPGSITGPDRAQRGRQDAPLFDIVAGCMPPDYGPHRARPARTSPACRRTGCFHTRHGAHVPDPARVRPHDGPREPDGGAAPASPARTLGCVLLRRGRVRKRERDVLERAEDVLEFLQLTKLRDERAGNLSGGQKKLLELGRTMMTDARVVLLDEPGAGVEPRPCWPSSPTTIQRAQRASAATPSASSSTTWI
ncbi:MAG: ATP-binding cassette domain-containing protein [Halofilum sp. (in: g-proteobacteria)]|nr:ATP-binding cassette domain-containing protein [Halofilum sp. (in: g-proteobacteria)]